MTKKPKTRSKAQWVLIGECDRSILIVISKTPHKMNCSNPSPEKDEKDVCRSAYHK